MSGRFRNNKFLYYSSNYLRQMVPSAWYRSQLDNMLQSVSHYERDNLIHRLNYYNKLGKLTSLGTDATPVGDLKIPRKGKVYHFDFTEFTRWFDPDLLHHHAYGDVTHIPEFPSIVKSRPIAGDNQNSVLMKLVKLRHFNFISDPVPFSNKMDHLIGMASVSQPHRVAFFERYFDHPMCTLGQINKGTAHDHWIRPKIDIRKHLDYKFILCLEGYDVASNLKWVMSSGSLAVMPEPVYETWYMEGELIPDVHYVRIAKDYSDLEERLRHYIEHPKEALNIVRAANDFTKRFRNGRLEDLLSLLVLEKYFVRTGQKNPHPAVADLF